VVFDDPSTSNQRLLSSPLYFNINNIALPKGILPTELSLIGLNSLQQDTAKFFRIISLHIQSRRKQPRFMLALIMPWIQTIIPQFSNIDNRILCIRDFHNVWLIILEQKSE